jgi:hypothetical protein
VALPRPWWLSINWNYNLRMGLDCYTDSVNSSSLYNAAYTGGTVMIEGSCISFGSNKGYAHAGVEYPQESCESSYVSSFTGYCILAY